MIASVLIAVLVGSIAPSSESKTDGPGYQTKMRIPVELQTVQGTLLEKGSYGLEVRPEGQGRVLVFLVGEEVRARVPQVTPDLEQVQAAEIPVVGTHFMRDTSVPIAPAKERQHSKTGMPRYQEEGRDWKAALRVYRDPVEGSAYFVFSERHEKGHWQKAYFRLRLSGDRAALQDSTLADPSD